MIGLLVLLYLALAFVLVRLVPSTWGKAIAIAVLVLIPTADAVYGRFRLKHFCAAQGGTQIYQSAHDVEGFYVSNEQLYESWLKRYGYKFIEGNLSPTEQVRLTLDPMGTVVRGQANTLRSRYRYERLENDTGGWIEIKEVITNIDGREMLGQWMDLNYYGGWVERGMSSLYGGRRRVGHCDVEDTLTTTAAFVNAVLQPSSSR